MHVNGVSGGSKGTLHLHIRIFLMFIAFWAEGLVYCMDGRLGRSSRLLVEQDFFTGLLSEELAVEYEFELQRIPLIPAHLLFLLLLSLLVASLSSLFSQ